MPTVSDPQVPSPFPAYQSETLLPGLSFPARFKWRVCLRFLISIFQTHPGCSAGLGPAQTIYQVHGLQQGEGRKDPEGLRPYLVVGPRGSSLAVGLSLHPEEGQRRKSLLAFQGRTHTIPQSVSPPPQGQGTDAPGWSRVSKIQIPGVGTDFGPLKYMPNQNLKKFRKQQRLITVENMVLGASLTKDREVKLHWTHVCGSRDACVRVGCSPGAPVAEQVGLGRVTGISSTHSFTLFPWPRKIKTTDAKLFTTAGG